MFIKVVCIQYIFLSTLLQLHFFLFIHCTMNDSELLRYKISVTSPSCFTHSKNIEFGFLHLILTSSSFPDFNTVLTLHVPTFKELVLVLFTRILQVDNLRSLEYSPRLLFCRILVSEFHIFNWDVQFDFNCAIHWGLLNKNIIRSLMQWFPTAFSDFLPPEQKITLLYPPLEVVGGRGCSFNQELVSVPWVTFYDRWNC